MGKTESAQKAVQQVGLVTSEVKAKPRRPFSRSEKSQKTRGHSTTNQNNTTKFVYTVDDPSRGSRTKVFPTEQGAIEAFTADITKLDEKGIRYKDCAGRFAKFIKCVTTEKGVLHIVQVIDDALDLNGKRIWFIYTEVKTYSDLQRHPIGKVFFANKKEMKDVYNGLVAKYEAAGWKSTTYWNCPNVTTFTCEGAHYYFNMMYGSDVIGDLSGLFPVQPPISDGILLPPVQIYK